MTIRADLTAGKKFIVFFSLDVLNVNWNLPPVSCVKRVKQRDVLDSIRLSYRNMFDNDIDPNAAIRVYKPNRLWCCSFAV